MEIKECDVINVLKSEIPEPKCELNFKNNYELLISVILSAQCTDKRVNIVTKELFKLYPSPHSLANANQEEIEKLIHSCGFYRNKAKNIISACKSIVNDFNGIVPSTKEELLKLDGVGEKTANVVFSVGFGGEAIAVDTHVFRVSNRLGISNSKTPLECEKQLQKFFSRENWSISHHLLVLFGRYICSARNPKCNDCKLNNLCKYYKENK